MTSDKRLLAALDLEPFRSAGGSVRIAGTAKVLLPKKLGNLNKTEQKFC